MVKRLGWLMTLTHGLAACGGGAERAAQSARIETLEHEVRRLDDAIRALKKSEPAPTPAQPVKLAPFDVDCPQPWQHHTPLGATLWNCRSPGPTPQGPYAQCNVTLQPQIAIETKEYFEFALNAAPQLHAVQNLKDKRIKINGTDAFEATFDADLKSVPLKMQSALLPHGEATYAITCFAPSAAFDSYDKAFRHIIDSFKFN